MAEVSYPYEDYPSEAAGAVTEAEYCRGIGWSTASGLIGLPSDSAPLFLSGGSLWLRAGVAARLVGMAYENRDDDLEVSISANGGGSARLDHVVLQLDWSTMLVRAAVLEGTAGGPLPGLTRARGVDEFEISLGQVSVPAGGSIATATLTRLGWYLGEDGQILCTSTTRPPHHPGRRIWETDTGRELTSTGAQWIVTAGTLVDLTVNTDLGSSWIITTDSVLTSDGRHVDLRAGTWTRSGAVAAGVEVRLPCTVPTAYRHPDRDRRVTVIMSGVRAARAILFSAAHTTRAGQLWLTEHPGLSSGNYVGGVDMGWRLP